MKKYRFVIVLAILLWAPGAFADAEKSGFEKPIRAYDVLPAGEFEAQTQVFESEDADNPALSYSIRLPVDWVAGAQGGSFSLDARFLGEVGRYYGPPIIDQRSFLKIEGEKLAFNIMAEQWLVQQLLARGYSVQGMNIAGPDRAEALYVNIIDSNSYVTRAFAQINGKYMIFVQHSVPMSHWTESRGMQAQVLDSFVLTHGQDDFVEEMQSFQFLDIAEFQYPKSWNLNSKPIRSIDEMAVQLLNVDLSAARNSETHRRILDGKIDIRLVSHFVEPDLDSLIEQQKEEFSEIGLRLTDEVSGDVSFDVHDAFSDVRVLRYRAVDEEDVLVSYESWMAFMSAGDYYYALTLLSPSREESYMDWVRNTQAFKLVVSLLKPQDE